MYLTTVNATAVYEFLGRPGMIMPDAKVLRNTPYILGHVGYEFAGEPTYTGGHTDADDMAAFLNFADRYLSETNVARASNGATAIASSNYVNGAYLASAAINGDHTGLSWGNNGGWNDGTRGIFPDWLEVDFNGSKSL